MDKEHFNIYEEIKDEEKVEFHLKNSVNKEINIISIEKLYSATLKINFEKKSSDKLTTFAWLKASDISSKDLEATKTNGLEISNRIQFIVGSLFPEEISEEEMNTEKEHCYILCKIIVGNSFCKVYDDKEEIDGFIGEEMESKFFIYI